MKTKNKYSFYKLFNQSDFSAYKTTTKYILKKNRIVCFKGSHSILFGSNALSQQSKFVFRCSIQWTAYYLILSFIELLNHLWYGILPNLGRRGKSHSKSKISSWQRWKIHSICRDFIQTRVSLIELCMQMQIKGCIPSSMGNTDYWIFLLTFVSIFVKYKHS